MRKRFVGSIVVWLVALLCVLSCAPATSAPIRVVTGSSLITDIVQNIAGNRVEPRTLIPPGVCPGHYDIKPSDVEALSKSRALLIHTYQQNFKNITQLVEAANNPNLIVKVINVEGNWMVPQVHAEAVLKIAQALGELDPENSESYQLRAEQRRGAILAKGEEVARELSQARVSDIKVICADMQAGFVKWAGFQIVATYGRPEDLSVADIEKLISQAREAGVALVIDNLQSGATATSEAMAQDIGAIQVTISNFPGGFENTETWEKALDKNVELLLAAVNGWRQRHG
jgi:zinc transport system substrate-binding protein